VSSLMVDRALDAIMRRVKNFDRKHDIPYLAGYSLDGKTIYIDRHMPKSFKGTSNYDGFFVGFAGATLRWPFLLLIWRGYASFYAPGAR
jgi:hypothetical protein